MSARVHAVQERRRSNAAGPHGSTPTRADELAAALADYEDNACVWCTAGPRDMHTEGCPYVP